MVSQPSTRGAHNDPCRWFHPDPELARIEKWRKEMQELYLKDQDAAIELEKEYSDKKEKEKAKSGPPPPPASLVEWQDLPAGIGALKSVELIGICSHRSTPAAPLPPCWSLCPSPKVPDAAVLYRGTVREGWRLRVAGTKYR